MNRGETSFLKLPKFAAKIYDRMMQVAPIKIQILEIANNLLNELEEGRLLDIGTGHGRLLSKIFEINPNLSLYGLDISEAMVDIANKNLSDLDVKIRHGTISETSYENDFFDLITSTGSFYLWNYPVKYINEIYRILKPNCSAIIFETYKEYDERELKHFIKMNLKEEKFFTKRFLPHFLKKQLKMTYNFAEFEIIIKQTQFRNHYDIKKINIGFLPIWVRIKLSK